MNASRVNASNGNNASRGVNKPNMTVSSSNDVFRLFNGGRSYKKRSQKGGDLYPPPNNIDANAIKSAKRLVDTINSQISIDKKLMSYIIATENNNNKNSHEQKFKELKKYYLSLKLEKLEKSLTSEEEKNKIEKLQIEINELKTNFRSLL